MTGQHQRNLWRATARPFEPDDDFENGERRDVVIIGGGIMGATAAMLLAARGVDCALVEAEEFGAGASSRPGGFIVPHFSFGAPSAVIDALGENGEWLVEAVGRAGEFVESLVREFNIDCDFSQSGWYQPAHNAGARERVEMVAADWRKHGFENEVLSGEEVERRTGVAGYSGGWYAPSGGGIHPLKFTLGMIERAAEAGAKVVRNCPVQRVKANGGKFDIELKDKTIRAERVLVCTNAVGSNLSPQLSRTIVRIPIWQCATKPIPAAERGHLFAKGECLSDTRANLFTYRFDSEWRLITGALEPLLIPSAQIGDIMASRLRRHLRLGSTPEIEFLWRGESSVTPSRFPEIEISDDGVISATSCNGRGIALAATFGAMLASTVMQENSAAAPYTYRRGASTLKVQFERCFVGGFPYYALAKDAMTG